MKRFTYALSVVAIVTACQTPAVQSTDAEAAPTAAVTKPSTEAAKEPDDSKDPANTHGLKLAKARESIAKLTQSLTRGEVERALGQPDATAFTAPDGSLTDTDTAGGGVRWTYEWTLPSGERTRFLIGFRSTAAGATVTHFYWQQGS